MNFCKQGKNDTESYNDNRDPQIPMEFDVNFEPDMQEAAASSSHPDFKDEEETGEPL